LKGRKMKDKQLKEGPARLEGKLDQTLNEVLS